MLKCVTQSRPSFVFWGGRFPTSIKNKRAAFDLRGNFLQKKGDFQTKRARFQKIKVATLQHKTTINGIMLIITTIYIFMLDKKVDCPKI